MQSANYSDGLEGWNLEDADAEFNDAVVQLTAFEASSVTVHGQPFTMADVDVITQAIGTVARTTYGLGPGALQQALGNQQVRRLIDLASRLEALVTLSGVTPEKP